jgi:hypothetical protein
MTAPGPTTARLELEDLMCMSSAQLWGLMQTGGRVDPEALAGQRFLGADLSMGRIGHTLLWETFRKEIVADEDGSGYRGWNVKLEQRGTRGAQVPKRRRDGAEAAFAHYRVRTDGDRITWPRGFAGATYFDYGSAGNVFPDGFGFTPVVTVNGDDHDLVLGWEIFRVAGRFVAPSMFWAIRPDGPVETVVAPPRTPQP